jgi:methylase of polypeptide subunit release factors
MQMKLESAHFHGTIKNLDDDLREQLGRLNITRRGFLDLGTGPATQAIELSKLGFQVTATDISENAITRAKRILKTLNLLMMYLIQN